MRLQSSRARADELAALDESLVTRWIGLVQLPTSCLLLVLDDGNQAALKEALQIPKSTPPESGETTLGHG